MSKSRHIRLSILLVWATAAPITLPWVADGGEPDSIYFHDSYNAAIREAKQTKKPIFLEFRCAP